MKLEKILVVEDNPKHTEDAKKFFADKDVEVVYATTFAEAEDYFSDIWRKRDKPSVDGVITDIYLPIGSRYKGRAGDEDPLGMLVAQKAENDGLPFVIITAGYHHGKKYNWISMFQRARGWPAIIDGSGSEEEADKKQWQAAYEALQEETEKLEE